MAGSFARKGQPYRRGQDNSPFLNQQDSASPIGQVSNPIIASLTASKLSGRGSLSVTGAPEAITLGTNLSMTGTTLNAASGAGGYTVVTKTAGYTETATSGELIIKADLAAGFTIVLPTAVGNTTKIHILKVQAAGSIIIDGAGAETINGSLTATLTGANDVLSLASDGANWIVV